ncbi:MAG: tyrosine-type recombinase/integrase, partial [Pseudomonadales bacterium]|nr:tyrosine-type recombinase/integrase [Pseudomonadales bacterium]
MKIVLDEFALKLELQARGNSTRTIEQQLRYAKEIVDYSDNWTLGTYKKFVVETSENFSTSTTNKKIQALKNLARVQKIHWIKEVKKIKEYNKPKDITSYREFWDFFNIDTGAKYNVLWRLILMTGARSSEILKLQRGDIDLERGCILINKDKIKQNRLAQIQPFFMEELTEYCKGFHKNDHLFYYRDKRQPLN